MSRDDGAAGEVRWLEDGVIAVDADGRLEAIEPYVGQAVDEDLRPGVLVPGFVDSHVHYPQTRIVGSASGPLLEWLAKSTFPEERRFADTDHAAWVAEAFVAALASAGTTTSMVYGSRHAEAADACLDAMDRRGLRGFVGPVWMDAECPDDLRIEAEQSRDDVERLVARWHGRDGRLQVAVVPRFAVTSTERAMRVAADVAEAHGLWVTTHLAENTAECAYVAERFGKPYLNVYEEAGLVHRRSVFAHCIHLDRGEWERFRAAGAVVAHCPDSNAFLGSGHMPTGDVLDLGVTLSIGTDVAAGRSFRVPRILSSAYDNALAVGRTVAPGELLYWGTRGGALALGMDHVGALEAGLDADMVLVDVPEWVEDADGVLAWTLFYADAPLPRRTWVRGRQVWDRDAWTAGGGVFPWDRPR